MSKNLENILKNIPKLPGVYQYFDVNKKLIYIGKSVSLHSRVNSYFNGKSKLNFAKKKMVSEIANIEIIVTNTAIESLLLETSLIKKHKPKYNILMKDDKNHTYIKITQELFPKVIKTRIKTKSGIYFGPYISTNYVNNIIKLTKKLFGHRSCNIDFESIIPPPDTKSPHPNPLPKGEGKKDVKISPLPLGEGLGVRASMGELELKTENSIKIKNTNGSKIPCIDYYIGRCSGPCLLGFEEIKKYRKSIENIKNFLSGDFQEVIQNLTKKMQEYAKNLQFEEAAKIKEDLLSLQTLSQNQIVRDVIGYDADVINFLEKYDKFYISKIEIRQEKITGIYNFEITDKLQDIDESVRFFIENNYIENSKKLSLILPRDLEIEKDFLQALNLKIEIPKIGEKTDILGLAYKNAFEFAYKKHLESLSVKGFTKKDMTELLNILGYKIINKDITFECNDISHISGSHTVASRSIIQNGKTAPNLYRKLKIKTLENGQINDFDSMREVMTRRLAEIKKTGSIPDLIIIDGGKGQLSSVLEIVEKEKEKAKNPPVLSDIPLNKGDNLISSPLSPTRERGGGGGQTGEGLGVRAESDENTHYLNLLSSLQLVSLAKREEELFLPYNSESILISKDSTILRMVQKIRDEAHRFAITFNRDSRIKASKKNILEELPGIGPKTRQKLLKHYGSVSDIKKDIELEKILNKNQIETLENHGII